MILMKEMHTLGQLSDEEYADLIKELWSIEASYCIERKNYE
jgi:hypothetical protein